MSDRPEWSDDVVEKEIAHLLRAGVFTAALVTLAGGLLYLFQHGTEPLSLGVFRGEPAELRSLPGIFHAAWTGGRRGLIQLGVVLLLATPVARVALMMVAFWRQRDRLFVTVSALVLTLLLYSLIFGT